MSYLPNHNQLTDRGLVLTSLRDHYPLKYENAAKTKCVNLFTATKRIALWARIKGAWVELFWGDCESEYDFNTLYEELMELADSDLVLPIPPSH